MGTMWQDIRYGMRVLAKSPGYALIAILMLGLGIGANSSIFSIVSTFILRPLPGIPASQELVRVIDIQRDGSEQDDYSYPDFADYRDQSSTVELAAQRMAQMALGLRESNDIVWGEIVSGNYFDVLRVRPQMGRTFSQEEGSVRETHPVIVIADKLWSERFNRDPSIVGRTIGLNGRDFTIIGIAPAGFHGSKWAISIDLWVPMMMQKTIMPPSDLLDERGANWFGIVGRVRNGFTRQQASDDLTRISTDLARLYPHHRAPGTTARAVPEMQGRFGDATNVVMLSSGLAIIVVGVLLLIVCANVANLMLARSLARQREIGIRLAVGASRWRLIRQLLTESTILALAGGLLGLGVAYWTSDLFYFALPRLPVDFNFDFSPDSGAVLYTFVIAVSAGLVFGLAPALHAARASVLSVLKGDTGNSLVTRRLSLRQALVIAQVALSVAVLVCGGLFTKSFWNVRTMDPGFDARQAFTMTVSPGLLGYESERGQDLYKQLVDRTRSLPGVEAASLVDLMPLGDSSSSTGPVIAEGAPNPQPGEGLTVLTSTVSPGYFNVLGIRMIAGRDVTDFDQTTSTRVAIINEALANRLWPNEDAVGKRFRIGNNATTLREVVGVVRNGYYRALGERTRPMLYLPLSQSYEPSMTLIVRTSGNSSGLIAATTSQVKALDARMPVFAVQTLEEHLTYAYWAPSLGATLAAIFGVLALLLVTLGLYGLISYTTTRRTKEIGVRIALGAQRGDLIEMISRSGLRLTLIGLAIGLPLAFGATLGLRSLLFGISRFDPIIFGAVVLILVAASLVSTILPARRATRINPIEALRYE